MRKLLLLAIVAIACGDNTTPSELCTDDRHQPGVELTSATSEIDRTCLLPLPCAEGKYEYFDSASPPHYDCHVFDIQHINQPDEATQELPPCDDALSVEPCWTVVADATCGGENLAVEAHRIAPPPADTHVLAYCTLVCVYCCETLDMHTCE